MNARQKIRVTSTLLVQTYLDRIIVPVKQILVEMAFFVKVSVSKLFTKYTYKTNLYVEFRFENTAHNGVSNR